MPRYIDADALIAFIKANGCVYANTLESFVVDDASLDRDFHKARAEAAEADMRLMGDKCRVCKKFTISCSPRGDELDGCAAFEWRGLKGGERDGH